MVLIHQLLVNGVDFVEELPNPLFKKILYSWIKSEARKSFHQRRLHDDGNLNAAASKLVFSHFI